MKEIILENKKHGMVVLVSCVSVLVLALAGLIYFGSQEIDAGMFVCLPIFLVGWIPLCGLRVLKPQEALVLTLFGKYVGTLKGEGFYFINPFCSAVNPAAQTKLNQSGDVSKADNPLVKTENGNVSLESVNKKISLKIKGKQRSMSY